MRNPIPEHVEEWIAKVHEGLSRGRQSGQVSVELHYSGGTLRQVKVRGPELTFSLQTTSS